MQQKLEQSVRAAQQGETKAFAALVHHFQDLAVGYAFGLLGDFHLAEDAAQDAFLEVHRTLANLRQPAAFPAWFRKIVFKHCDRRLRRKRLATIPAEDGDIASGHADPGQILEHREMQRHVQKEIEHLPESERQVITLFYLAGHTQPQIADLLELPLTTIKKRLYSARQRLKKSMVDAVEEYFLAHRPSRATVFKTGVLNMIDAVTRGDIPRIRQLLEDDPRLLRAPGGRWHRPPLHHAAEYGHQAVIELLLTHGAHITDADQMDHATALHWAASSGQLEVVQMLVDLGADVNDTSDDHQAGPLGWACLGSTIQRDTAEYLLTHGAQLDIFSAIALGKKHEIAQMLESDPTILHQTMSRNEHFRTPLHFAVEKREIEIVDLLLKHGADPNAPDATGAPPLSLLGVPPLPLLGAPEQATFPPPSKQLKSDMIARFSLAGAEIDLYSAVTLEFYDRAKELLTSAPERIQPKGREHRILHFATISNHPKALRWLLEHGADPNAKAEIWDCNATPLHFAAEHGLVEAAQELLKAAPDLTITDDKFNATPLGWAQHCNQPTLAQLIEQHV